MLIEDLQTAQACTPRREQGFLGSLCAGAWAHTDGPSSHGAPIIAPTSLHSTTVSPSINRVNLHLEIKRSSRTHTGHDVFAEKKIERPTGMRWTLVLAGLAAADAFSPALAPGLCAPQAYCAQGCACAAGGVAWHAALACSRAMQSASAHVCARMQAAAVCARDGASRTAHLMVWRCIPRAGGALRLRRPRADLSMRVGPRQKLLIEVPSNANVHVVAAVKEVPPVDACACACA